MADTTLKKTLRTVLIGALLATIADTSARAAGQLVQNGGFETGDFTGWTQSGNLGATVVSTAKPYALFGTYGAALGPSGSLGFLSQTLATTPGQSYVLSFWLDSPDGSLPTQFQASWNGSLLYQQVNLPSNGWVNLQFPVTASGAATVVQFGFQDNPSYLGLDNVSLKFIPTAVWTNPAPIVYGTRLSAAQCNATASYGGLPLAGVGVYNPPLGTILTMGPHTLSVTFNPTDSLNYSSTTTNVTVVVTPAPLMVTALNATRTLQTTNPTFSPAFVGLTNGDQIAVSFSCSAAPASPAGTYAIIPSLVNPQGRATNYVVSLFNGTLIVANYATILTWAAPAGISYGTGLTDTQLNATATYGGSNVPGVFVYAPPAGTVLPPGNDTLSVNFTPADTNFAYTDPSTNVTIIVSNVPPNDGAAYTFSTIAGNAGSGSEDGIGSAAQFDVPNGLAVDPSGNIFVADSLNYTIRKITPGGHVSTIAGLARTFGSTDGMNNSARFGSSNFLSDPNGNPVSGPSGLALDTLGNIYVADLGNHTIRKVTPSGTNWMVTTVAGQAGVIGSRDGQGTNALFYYPSFVAVDAGNNVYVSDTFNFTVRRITPDGYVTTIAGAAGISGSSNAFGTNATFEYTYGLAVDGATNIYVADSYNDLIRKISLVGSTWSVTTMANLDLPPPGFGIVPFRPNGVAVDKDGTVYTTTARNDTLVKITPGGVISTMAGSIQVAGSANGTGTNALFSSPGGVAVDLAHNVYVADLRNNTIRKVTSAGVVSTIAGQVVAPGNVDGVGRAARFARPGSVTVDTSGNVYVADTANNTIRAISSDGEVNTIAGSPGVAGTADGAGNYAQFNGPQGIAVDLAGNLYVADTANNAIRMVTPAGSVTTIAGQSFNTNQNFVHFGGSTDGIGTNAQFYFPSGIAVDPGGNLYVMDKINNTVREITPMITANKTNWLVSTIAGVVGSTGTNDGPGNSARFHYPSGIAVDNSSNVYVLDTDNLTIRMVSYSGGSWNVQTIAGRVPTNTFGFGGIGGSTDGVGTNALFGGMGFPGNSGPMGIASDASGILYVSDTYNQTIRKVTPLITASTTNWAVATVGGMPGGGAGAGISGSEDGAGAVARFNGPQGIAVDGSGNIYIADTVNNTIRKGVFAPFTAAVAASVVAAPTTGSVMVTLLPPEANGQWRFPWELAWRNSGTTAVNLSAGNYPVVFRDLPGYIVVPLGGTVGVTNGGTTYLTNQYFPTIAAGDPGSGGSLVVNIGPSPPSGARWGFLGESTNFPPGYSTNLAPGTYLIAFAVIPGYATPPNQAVQVNAGAPTILTENYLVAAGKPPGVLLPTPVPANQLSDLADYPFGYNGQLQTDTGFGSGVAVEPNVVLTAAHVVFNDQTLSYVNQAYWFWQESAPTPAAKPLQARSLFLLSGYAAQRTNDVLGGVGPDQSTPQSRNLDVAALYFLSPAAGGGSGGFLPSDNFPNQWLTGTGEKMLVGYPVDGSLFGDSSIVPGAMYVAGPQPYQLSPAPDPISGQQEVYTASWFLGYPGDSGGPVYAQLNGNYYPVGVYLGTLFSGTTPSASAVRAIDSNVVSLITLAATEGSTGTNNSGGGVITVTPSQGVGSHTPGYLQVLLEPPSAVKAGAKWRLAGDTSYSTASNYTEFIYTNAATVVQFSPIPGWNVPSATAGLSITPGHVTQATAIYTVVPPVLTFDAAHGLGLMGTTETVYQIQTRASLSTGNWVPLQTNTISSNGINVITNNPPTGFYRAMWLTN